MARKKHLINVHTSTGTTAPSGASLYLGEIAVQHTPNDPALWIKMGTDESSEEYEKFIGQTEIINMFDGINILGSGYTYSGLPYINSSTTIADAFSALTSELLDDELVTAAALNDLNNRVLEISGQTGDNTELLEYVQENEEVVAGALNNLNNRVGTVETRMTGDYIPVTGFEMASGSTEEELTIVEEDTVNEAIGKLQKQMLDNEEAIAAGFNDLNKRLENVDEAISHSTGITQLSGAVRSLSAATLHEIGEIYDSLYVNSYNFAYQYDLSNLSAATVGISAKTSGVLTISANGVEQGRYSPSANTTIDLQIVQEVTGDDVLLTGYALATGSTEEELAIVATDTVNEAFGKIQKQNYDNEAVVAGALNDLDERVTVLEISGGGGSSTDVAALSAAVVDHAARINEIEVSAATNQDLYALSGAVVTNQLSVSSALTDLDERVTLLEVSGSSGDDLAELSGAVKAKEFVIASALNDLNSKIIELSGNTGGGGSYVLPIASSSVLGGVKIGTGVSIAADGTISVTGGGGGDFGPLSSATYSHVTNNDIHVTTSDKSTWNGKQDTISDLATIRTNAASGMSAYNSVNELSSATHTHSTNSDIHVTTSDKSTWNGKQDSISDLETIRNNASSGATAYSNVNSLSAATTGMNASLTAHTASTDTHVTAAQKTAWTNGSNSGASAYTAVTALSAATTALTAASANYFDGAEYVSSAKSIVFKNGEDIKSQVDATAFIKDGMVSSVTIADGNMVITFNTDAGREDIELALTDIFDPDDYYTKTEINTGVSASTAALSAATTAHTANTTVHITADERTRWQNAWMSGVSAYTKVEALSAATTGINNTLTAHTANTTVHVTSEDKTAWNGKQDTINDLSDIRNNASSGAAAYTNVNNLSAVTITGVSMNGANVTVTDKVATLGTVVTAQTQLSTASTGTGNVVTDITVNNHQITKNLGMTVPAWATASTKPSYTASEVGALPTGTTLDNVADGSTRKLSNYATTGTVNTLNNTVTAHTADTTAHVTTAEKSTWNGKANTSDITITGLTVGGTNATITNKVAAVPTASTNTFGVIKTGDFLTNTNGTVKVSTGTTNTTVAVGNHTHSNYAASGAVTTLSSATQSIQSSAQTAYNNRITGGTITSGATNSITTTNNRVAITAATLPSYSTANNDQVLMIKNGVPQWVTPSTITYSSSAPTGGNDGDIWIQTS